MARHKDTNWNLAEGTPNGKNGTTHEWQSIHAALLMDIRDELKTNNAELRTLNALLHCRNFTGIPKTLSRIDRRIAEGVKLPKGRTKSA